MIMPMDIHLTKANGKEPTLVRGVSLRKNLWDWLYQEAELQEHGNVSRVVQEAVREYRDGKEFKRRQVERELERIA